MIDSSLLLSTLQRQLNVLLDDLRTQAEVEPQTSTDLHAEYDKAFEAGRTGWTFTQWADDRLTQVAVGWLLGCVFVRFCEDNGLIDDPMIASPTSDGTALVRAAQQDYFRANPNHSDRDYLKSIFHRASQLRGLDGVLAEDRSPLWLVDPSADACTELLVLFRRSDDDGSLILDFTDPNRDTRFLGDLYQDLSEHAKKTYALLQTPVFVEEFILDRTLDPAIESVGLSNVSLIDPTCGSGHFLLGAFERLWNRWATAEPAMPADQRAAKALNAIWGVDINPFAAAIARFRLLVAAMIRVGQQRLADVRDYPIHVAVGDSLLWGADKQTLPGWERSGESDVHFLYATEDADALRETFDRKYTAVVGNPPYIVPKDKAANAAYRDLYDSCYRQYSLGVPFTEVFFKLAASPNPETGRPAGFIGMITANSFMKREFGKRLIEDFIPRWDLTHVIDTSGAYIPGHGTPTVILLGRNQSPVGDTIRAVQGIRGEPSTPADPATGHVWSAIVDQIDEPGSESDYISVDDVDRERFSKHPWSISGGGAAELKEWLDENQRIILRSIVDAISTVAITREDDAYFAPTDSWARFAVPPKLIVPLGKGEDTRDWIVESDTDCLFPYDTHLAPTLGDSDELNKIFWPTKQYLLRRKELGGYQTEVGKTWYEWNRFLKHRFRTPLSITFAFKATHNHFVLDRGGKVFNRTAPVIKLHSDRTIDDHLALLGLLNSSTANFWVRQVSQPYGATEPWAERFERDSSKIEQFPLPSSPPPIELARRLDDLARELTARQPLAVAEDGLPTRDRLDAACREAERIRAEMISAQEELDWECLHLYGLTDVPLTAPEGQTPPPLALGERAFEIILARKVAAGETETAWFTRHRSTPITELPNHWPDWYRDLVERRIELIESDRNIGLVERPEHKRRWATETWDKREHEALQSWLLDRLEDRSFWFDGDYATTRTLAQLADRVAVDEDWMTVARVYADSYDIDPQALVTELVADEHVPAQSAARYKESGLRKRAEWEHTWDLQRAEDRGEDVGRIAVPPKYTQADFLRPSYWKQRGKLDVPKERFVSVTGAEREVGAGDSSAVFAWAGFDHAQMAQSLATLLHQRRTNDGWDGERLIPLIAALDEVVPWVTQWHPDVDPGLGQPLGTFYRDQVDQALASIGATRETLVEWRPPTKQRGRKKRSKTDDHAKPATGDGSTDPIVADTVGTADAQGVLDV